MKKIGLKQLKRGLALFLSMLLAAGFLGTSAMAAGGSLPILMYHAIVTDPSLTDSMTITQERLREDMEFLQAHGFTPLFTDEIIAIANGQAAMPDKPVMITFDDGYANNYTLAYPVLQETGMKATISLITSQIRETEDDPFPNSLLWEQVAEMYESGLVDFGSHTHDLHNRDSGGMWVDGEPNGIQRRAGESYTAYRMRVGGDIITSIRLIQEHLGRDVRVRYFSYPLGATDTWFNQVIYDHGLMLTTTTEQRTASVTGGLFSLPRYRITMETPVSELLQQSAAAQAQQVTLDINGQEVRADVYKIEGSNYIKLRDAASLLAGTRSEFAVDWADGLVTLESGQAYEPVGGELARLDGGHQTVKSVTSSLMINGEKKMLAGYVIDENNYFKLASLGDALGFSVSWDAQTGKILVKA